LPLYLLFKKKTKTNMWYAALSKHSQILLETISFWPLA